MLVRGQGCTVVCRDLVGECHRILSINNPSLKLIDCSFCTARVHEFPGNAVSVVLWFRPPGDDGSMPQLAV